MKFLDFLPYETLSNFSITLGENDCGWLDLELSTVHTKVDYVVSYIIDPWEELIGNFIALVNDKSKGSILGIHDLEGGYVCFIFDVLEDKMRLNIFKNWVYPHILEELMWIKFDTVVYYKENYQHFPIEENQIIFSLEDSIFNFSVFFLNLIEQIRNKACLKGYEPKDKVWGYFIPEIMVENLKVIKTQFNNSLC